MAPLVIVWLSLLFSSLVYLIIFQMKEKANRQKKQLPPSPSSLPILGNLHQLGELLHKSYWKLSKKHGPVMLLRHGRIPTVVVSSVEAARDVFKVHDLACSNRPALAGVGRLSYNFLDVAFSPYGEYWRNMKKLIVLELFSLKRVQSFRFIREDEVKLLVNSISDSAASETPIDLTDKLFALIANITYRMSFGFDNRETNFDRGRFHEVIHEAEEVIGSITKAMLFPLGGWIIDWITGHHAKVRRVFHELDSFFEYVINDHLKSGREKNHSDIVDVLLRIKDEQTQLGSTEFTMNNVKAILVDLLIAGIETSAITLNWAMAELVRNPRVMQKLQDEVRNHFGNKGKVNECDLDKLEYLKMVIKETFRLHPAAPLLLPRETISHCKIDGYDIEPKTMVRVNVWAIGRDPKLWKEPEKFYPERFADSSIDYKGHNFELTPFGAGRRMCPAIHMGMKNIENVLANLLYLFNWKLPEGMREEDMNMEERPGVNVNITKRTPLILVPEKHLQ